MAVGDAEVDFATGEIERLGRRVRLTPKAAQTLQVLCESPGEAVSKERLIERVWADAFVTDHVVWHCVAELRRAFDDDAREPSVIETLPRRGYRLLARVAPLRREPRGVAAPPARRRTRNAASTLAAAACALAVVVAYLSGPETSPPTRPDEALVEDAEEAYRRYTAGHNERALELFEAAVDLEPADARAHAGLANAYAQKAMFHSTESWWSELAIETARRAVHLDPALAESHKALGLAFASEHRLEEAAAAYRRALDLEPDHVAALNNLALTETTRGNLSQGARLLERASRLVPRDVQVATNLGGVYRLLGLSREARATLEAVAAWREEAPPASVVWELALLDVAQGGLDVARQRVAQAARRARRSPALWLGAGSLELLSGHEEVAEARFRNALPSPVGWEPRPALLWLRVGGGVGQPPQRLMREFVAKEEQSWHRELPESAVEFAAVRLYLGQKEEALAWLERAVDRGYRDRQWLGLDPLFEALHGAPRFEALLRQIDQRVAAERAELRGRVAEADAREWGREPG
jgi:DNA-binding winged helix-turn-helix (wHTH) protein/Flp pilus assembly protein TadD